MSVDETFPVDMEGLLLKRGGSKKKKRPYPVRIGTKGILF